MDIVVKGRNVEVPAHFRERVAEKLAPSERLDSRVLRVDVELYHEPNPRQSANCQRVEITCRRKGPVIRAEACAADFYAALDAVTLKLEARLRKAHDRRRIHHGRHTPPSVAQATAELSDSTTTVSPNGLDADASREPVSAESVTVFDRPAGGAGEAESAGRGSDDTALLIVRDKTHAAAPMSTAEALHEMELVGHDFYLFADAVTGLPSVVYRRHGYDYGVLRLATG